MKYLVRSLIVGFCICVGANSASATPILNNSGSTGEDSVHISFQNWNVSGTRTLDVAAGDSVYLMVIDPSGTLCFRDSMAANNAKITMNAWEDWAGGDLLVYKNTVAAIDGNGVSEGNYAAHVWVHDIDSNTYWYSKKDFQLYVTADLNAILDKINALTFTVANVLDANATYVSGSAAAADTLEVRALRKASLAPTTEGRTLDVTATGAAGIDWNNVENPTSALALANTNINRSGETGLVELLNTDAIPEDAFVTGAISARAVGTGAIGASELAGDAAREIGDSTLNRATNAMTWAAGSFANLWAQDSTRIKSVVDSLLRSLVWDMSKNPILRSAIVFDSNLARNATASTYHATTTNATAISGSTAAADSLEAMLLRALKVFDANLTHYEGNTDVDGNIQSEATDALNAYDPPTNAEMVARTLAAASYFDPAADPVAVVTRTDSIGHGGTHAIAVHLVDTNNVARDATKNDYKATGFATPTNITAGTITTVTNVTNSPFSAANAGSVADSVWRKGGAKVRLVDGDTTAIAMLYHIRDSMDEASQTAASSLDSIVVWRLLRRMFGLDVASGDTLTVAQRTVTDVSGGGGGGADSSAVMRAVKRAWGASLATATLFDSLTIAQRDVNVGTTSGAGLSATDIDNIWNESVGLNGHVAASYALGALVGPMGFVGDSSTNTTTRFRVEMGNHAPRAFENALIVMASSSAYGGDTLGLVAQQTRRILQYTSTFSAVRDFITIDRPFTTSSMADGTTWDLRPRNGQRFWIISDDNMGVDTVTIGRYVYDILLDNSHNFQVQVVEASMDTIAAAARDSVWAADTSNALWNGIDTRFGYWNAARQVGGGGGGSSNWTDAQRDSVLRSLQWATNNSLVRLADVAGLTLSGSNKNVVIFVIDTSGVDDTLPGVIVSVKDAGQTANLVGGLTVSPGVITFGLMASTQYVPVPSLTGYVFPGAPLSFTTTAGAGPDTVNIYGYNFDPGTPASPSLCRVYGYLGDGPNAIRHADVTLTLEVNQSGVVVVDTVADRTVAVRTFSTKTDADGYWYIDVVPNVYLTPGNTTYGYTASKAGVTLPGQKKAGLTVPTSASVRIEDLL